MLLMSQWRTAYSVIDCVEPFLEGFWELIPPGAMVDIQPEQLNLMLNGRPDVDIEEIRAYTIYQGKFTKYFNIEFTTSFVKFPSSFFNRWF